VKEGKQHERICLNGSTFSNVAYEQHHIATKDLVNPECYDCSETGTLLGFAPDGPPSTDFIDFTGFTSFCMCEVRRDHQVYKPSRRILCMEFHYAYEEMLDRAISNLPEKVFAQSRFEIPKSDSFTMGNRTVVKNFQEIAQKMSRDPNHLMKFLSGELATSGNFESRGAVFQGRFNNFQINEKIEKYAHTYVLCHECGKPDTALKKEGRIVFLQCEACGARHSVRSI
jgi:translation initiation factor 2 subunit 2